MTNVNSDLEHTMTPANSDLENTLQQNEISMPQDPTNTIILTLNGQDYFLSMETLGVNFESTEREILDVAENFAVTELHESLKNNDEYTYSINKAVNSRNIYCFPKPEAGQYK